MNKHPESSACMMPQLTEEGTNQWFGTKSKVFRVCRAILLECHICVLCVWKAAREKSSAFYHFNDKNISRHQQVSVRRNNKDKELKKGTNLHWCNAAVIKEIKTRNTKTPAVTDGGGPGKQITGQQSTASNASRNEGRILRKVGRIYWICKNLLLILLLPNKHSSSQTWTCRLIQLLSVQ